MIFIDEIHKYQGWNQEIKNLYDAFPALKIVFSGSSMLDLIEGSHDLSRRAKLYGLHGLSFREYLNFALNLDLQPMAFERILENPSECVQSLKEISRLLPHFEAYLKKVIILLSSKILILIMKKYLGSLIRLSLKMWPTIII